METFKEQALQWLEENSRVYEMSVTENEFVFSKSSEDKSLTFSFTITCPQEPGTKFNVWSESDIFRPHLSRCMDICESSNSTDIKEVLSTVHELLSQGKIYYGKSDEMAVDDDDEAAGGGDDEMDDDDDDDDAYGDYYVHEDPPDEPVESKEEEEEDEEIESFFGKGVASAAAFQRLRKDLKNMKTESHNFGVEGNPRGDNIFIWDVRLTGFSADTKLGKDLQEFATKYKRDPVVYLEMQFPLDYPMAPPFVRVIRPRFKFLTGHVTIGGSICMEMLTKSGWRPTNDIESILVQIRSEIMSDNNARLDSNPDREYGEREAKDAFNRMVSRYGWNS